MEIIEEHAPQLGFTASVSFTLPPGSGPDETLAHDILAVTREALSNCARHARATAVTIVLALQDGLITLEVTDNGRGPGTPARPSGLASMRRRAEGNGGTLQTTAPAADGTQLTWTARPRHSAIPRRRRRRTAHGRRQRRVQAPAVRPVPVACRSGQRHLGPRSPSGTSPSG